MYIDRVGRGRERGKEERERERGEKEERERERERQRVSARKDEVVGKFVRESAHQELF